MDFDWTTFVLEIINFLVLVWILKRFFYRPVLEVIARRRAGIEDTMTQAHAAGQRALDLKAQYEHRLADWDKERDAARARLAEDIAGERERLMGGVLAEIAAEREKNRVLEERQRQERQRLAEEQALEQGAAFVARLMPRLADRALDERIVEAMIADLARLTQEQKRALAAAAAAPDARVRIASAHPLAEPFSMRLSGALAEAVGRVLPVEQAVDAALIGGVLVSVGPWLLHANLRDEMQFFSGGARRAS